jgi:hypothetical protein
MNLKPVTAQGILKVGRPTADRGMNLSFVSQELPDSEKLALLGYHQTFGHLLFSPNEIQESDVPKNQATKIGKSPSERLRSVLFLIYMETGGKPEDFYIFYNAEMEKIINHYKLKISIENKF